NDPAATSRSAASARTRSVGTGAVVVVVDDAAVSPASAVASACRSWSPEPPSTANPAPPATSASAATATGHTRRAGRPGAPAPSVVGGSSGGYVVPVGTSTGGDGSAMTSAPPAVTSGVSIATSPSSVGSGSAAGAPGADGPTSSSGSPATASAGAMARARRRRCPAATATAAPAAAATTAAPSRPLTRRGPDVLPGPIPIDRQP